MNSPLGSALSKNTHLSWPSMVIRDLHFIGIMALPNEANLVLVIDPNAVLPAPVTMQFLQPVSGRNPQVVQRRGPVEHAQFSSGHAGWRCSPGLARSPDFRRLLVGESLDHRFKRNGIR